jgi:hypothetical protein
LLIVCCRDKGKYLSLFQVLSFLTQVVNLKVGVG